MTSKKKILLVDDEPDQTAIVAEWLSAGHEVIALGSPEAALAELAKSTYDLLITDFSMPKMNGAQLIAKAIKLEGCAGLRVILLTGIQDDLAILVIRSIPRIRFVEKPIRKKDFLPIVDEVLN
jgi:CheY-like chemotaxis protein